MGEITPKNECNVGSHGKWDDPPSNRPDIHLAGRPPGSLVCSDENPENSGCFRRSRNPQGMVQKIYLSSDQNLAVCSIEGVILPSYIGIIISHYKDPYQPTSIMECQQGFERCSLECPVGS